MNFEVLGAILTMIAPFIFHFLLQTELKMRNIILIMSGIILLGVLPVIDFGVIDKYLRLLPRAWLVWLTVIMAVLVLGSLLFFILKYGYPVSSACVNEDETNHPFNRGNYENNEKNH